MDIPGLVIIDKPAGWSSFKVTQHVRKTLNVKRAGHTGTLDPFATGVLPICINDATRTIQFLQEDEKEYEGSFILGLRTDSFDLTGRIISSSEVPDITMAELQKACSNFLGLIDQIPPSFAAAKFKGKPLYYWARRGIFIQKEPRAVNIKEFTLRGFDPPEVSFKVVCSKGTYIRSLVNDLGERIGCGASLKNLRRLRSGPFTIDQAVAPDVVDAEHIHSVSDILSYLPSVEIDEIEAQKVREGRALILDKISISPHGNCNRLPWVRLISKYGDLIAISVWRDSTRSLQPVRVFRAI